MLKRTPTREKELKMVRRRNNNGYAEDLGPRGRELWEALKTGESANDAIALEAARATDRLDDLNNILLGRGVLNLMRLRLDLPTYPEDPYTVEIVVDDVLKEARQLQVAQSQLLSRIRRLGGSTATVPATPGIPAATEPQSGPGLATVSPLEAARRAANGGAS